jgi:hypothetical protein
MKQGTSRASSAPKENLGPNSAEGLRYAKKAGDQEMVRAFSAIIKTICRAPERYDEAGGHRSASTTKRVDLTLTDEIWALLELHAERVGGPVVWEIETVISRTREKLEEGVRSWKRADLERQLASVEDVR